MTAFEKSPLASWSGATPKPPALPAPKTMAGRIFFVHVPNAAQSSVQLLQFGPKRTAADYFPNTMMASARCSSCLSESRTIARVIDANAARTKSATRFSVEVRRNLCLA